MLRLSHSALSKFQTCGKAYEFHYIQRIRPTKPRTSLLFGSAMDKAIGAALVPDKKTPHEIFDYFWRFQEVNGKEEYIPKYKDLLYSNKDFDEDLLLEEDYVKIQREYNLNKEQALELAYKRIDVGHDRLTDEEKQRANFIFWHVMRRKGHTMIDAFIKKIMPRIKKIHSTQEYITLENDEGDKVIGYVDLVAELEGVDGPIILDIKTAASPYEEDAHLTSPQLILYVHATREKYNTNKAGFIVLGKNIIKNRTKICSVCGHDGSGGRAKTCDSVVEKVRCNGAWLEKINPECFTQVMYGDVPQQTEDLVMENIDDISRAIKEKHFTRNLSNCANQFGSRCDYYDLCYKGKMTDLKKME